MIKKGDPVTIHPQWRDPGDDEFLWIAASDEEKGRLDIVPLETDLQIRPMQVIESRMLCRGTRVIPMKREEALDAYREVCDVKDEVQLRAVLPRLRDLVYFWQFTKGLTWPGSYGVPPWDYASRVASLAAGGKVTNSTVLESDDHAAAMRYREMAGVSVDRDADGMLRPDFSATDKA